MKEATIEQFKRDPGGFLDVAQQEELVVTRDGKPFAIIVGAENKDAEDLELESSPEFWRMIEARRKEPTVPLEEIERELLEGD